MLVVTPAIVLHAFDYLETSRILRLLTSEAGIQSVLAKGARRSRGRVGSAVDLFAEGEAQLYLKPSRELQTLSSFDITVSRAALAFDMERFLAASAMAELALRVGSGETNLLLYQTVSETLTALATATHAEAPGHALAGGWCILAAVGFTPSLDHCATCHAELQPDTLLSFSSPAGGALCDRCARLAPASRRLPPAARNALRAWLSGERPEALSAPETRAHQRLLREFLAHHIPDDRPLRAFATWESGLAGVSISPEPMS
ncbi:MAG TPA: DNA repair protein RecO [Gemmatimonadaceae bacterium]|jgi:DNA repair protein RecO (recombination protein O)|nr:DNA repair protein RecO [Gemmatimonadaceae bacterium]